VPFWAADLHKEEEIDRITSLLRGRCDVLLGGPPCQGFSTLGNRAPNCRISSLVDVFLQMTLSIKPKIIVMENVRGLASKVHPSGVLFPEFIKKTLEQSVGFPRYRTAEFLVDAQEYGLAQTRLRYILVAVRDDLVGAADMVATIVEKIEQQKQRKRATLREAIGDLPKVASGEGGDVYIERYKGRRRAIYNHKAMNHSQTLQKRLSFVPQGGGLPDVPRRLLTEHLKRMLDGKYGSGGHVKNIYGRLQWDEACGTIVAGMDKITCGRFVHPDENRLLTPRECARIQSFPDSFRFFGGQVTQYYSIGNAVPPKLSSVFANAVFPVLAALRPRARERLTA